MNERIEREEFFARNAFLAKKKTVLSGKSKIFKNWAAHSTITEKDFIEALDWLCDDALDEKGRMTREIGLTPTGIVKLHRIYDDLGFCSLFLGEERWTGAYFKTPCTTEKERLFSMDGENIEAKYNISLSCRDRV